MYFPVSVLGQVDRLVMLLPRKAAFELRLALASQLRAKALRKDLLKPLGGSSGSVPVRRICHGLARPRLEQTVQSTRCSANPRWPYFYEF